MNPHTIHSHAAAEPQALEARFGHRVSAALAAAELPADVTERLRFAREQALARRKQPVAAAAPVMLGHGGAAVLGGSPREEKSSRWWQLASALPFIVLLAGLFLIHEIHTDRQIRDAADIDAALLSDDLPPEAYADPGFAEFLKAPGE